VTSIVCVSRAVARSISTPSNSYRNKVRVIHNALPPHIERHLQDLNATRHPKGGNRAVVVASGRLAEQKNYAVLLQAASLLPNVTFQIIGSGPERATLERLSASLGVADRVRFRGQASREEALSIVSDGGIFVQMSLFEGHSLGLIEASKLGLPLVVSDVPSQTEGVTAADETVCGIIVGVSDHVALAGRIQQLLTDDTFYFEYASLSEKLGRDATFQKLVDSYIAASLRPIKVPTLEGEGEYASDNRH
jgi:glycosyltransferase involved in cell wall biosynthesis